MKILIYKAIFIEDKNDEKVAFYAYILHTVFVWL